MKKTIPFIFLLLLNSISSISQTTATDFNIASCSGTSHHLFAELDAGKVVVISFIEPCGSCIAPSLTAYSAVLGYATTNPDKVVFYISDDLANSSCGTLQSWATQNGMGSVEIFSNSALVQTQYGNGGMPKIVVIASNRQVKLNQNSSLSVNQITTAINAALATSAVNEVANINLKLKAFPNPVNENLLAEYFLDESSEVTFELVNMLGAKVKSVSQKQSAGKHDFQIETETLNNGIYFLKISSGSSSQTIKVTISH
jgi:Secretion system C-terminal sorting domain